MNKDDALKLALEALEYFRDTGTHPSDLAMSEDAITAIEEALEQPEEERLHPVHIGVDVTREGTSVTAFYRKPDAVMEMFYSQFHPLAQRTWVGLTDEDLEAEFGFIDELLRDCCYRTESKLKEKNVPKD